MRLDLAMDKSVLVVTAGRPHTTIGPRAFTYHSSASSVLTHRMQKRLVLESGYSHQKKLRLDLKPFRESIRRQAEQKLGLKLSDESRSDISLWIDLPESRHELLRMLTRKQEGQFADRMVSHFCQLAKLIPIINQVFNIGPKRRGRQAGGQ